MHSTSKSEQERGERIVLFFYLQETRHFLSPTAAVFYSNLLHPNYLSRLASSSLSSSSSFCFRCTFWLLFFSQQHVEEEEASTAAAKVQLVPKSLLLLPYFSSATVSSPNKGEAETQQSFTNSVTLSKHFLNLSHLLSNPVLLCWWSV